MKPGTIENQDFANDEVYALPTSFAQHRLWFLHQLEPDSPAYNISAAYRLKGALNVAALEQSFTELIRRHEILRTTFLLIDGEPMQVVEPDLGAEDGD